MINAFFDGACEPVNPGGLVSVGYHYELNGEDHFGHFISFSGGESATNQVAEYTALGALLVDVLSNQDQVSTEERVLIANGDNQSVVNIFNGRWRANAPNLKPIAGLVHMIRYAMLKSGWTVAANWIPRTENVRADKLSRKSLNELLKDREPLTERLETGGYYDE